MSTYTIGVDYGTDSVRALVVDTQTGEEMGTHVFYYPRWKEGKYCDPARNQFRQHPLDYLEGLEVSIVEALKKCPGGCGRKGCGDLGGYHRIHTRCCEQGGYSAFTDSRIRGESQCHVCPLERPYGSEGGR